MVARGLGLAAMGAQVFMHISGLTEANFLDAEVNHIFVAFMAAILVTAEKYQNQLRLDL